MAARTVSSDPLLSSSVKPLIWPPFTLNGYRVDELSASAEVEEDDVVEAGAGEDGLGLVSSFGQGWDESGIATDEKEEQAWLEEDDIGD